MASQNEVDDMIKRIQTSKGVQGNHEQEDYQYETDDV